MNMNADYDRMVASMSTLSPEVRKFLDSGQVTIHVDEDNVTAETIFNTCVTRFVNELSNFGISITLPLEDIFMSWRRIDRFLNFSAYLLPEGLGFKLLSDEYLYGQILSILNGSYSEEGDTFSQYMHLLRSLEGGKYEGIIDDLVENTSISAVFTTYLSNMFNEATLQKSLKSSDESISVVREFVSNLSKTMFYVLDSLDLQMNLKLSTEKLERRIAIYCQQLRNIDFSAKLAWWVELQHRRSDSKNILHEEIMLEEIYSKTILEPTKLNASFWGNLDNTPNISDVLGMIVWEFSIKRAFTKNLTMKPFKERVYTHVKEVLSEEDRVSIDRVVDKFDMNMAKNA